MVKKCKKTNKHRLVKKIKKKEKKGGGGGERERERGRMQRVPVRVSRAV